MALNKTMTFDLELKPGGIPPIVHASQGDIGRMFKANIYWDGSAATSYISGATVNLRGRKPDKTVFDYSATLAGSMVTFETTEQMTIIPGPVECELVFSNDGDIIASANFVLIVEDSPYDPDALSESDVYTLTELVIDAIGDAITTALENNMIDTAHIDNLAVTTAKLAGGSVSWDKLAPAVQGRIATAEGDIDNLEEQLTSVEGDIDNLEEQLTSVAKALRKTLVDVSDYSGIQALVRAGLAKEVFNIGDQLVVPYTATNGKTYDMPFDVVDFRDVTLENGDVVPGMFLQSHYATLEAVQFDAPETTRPASDDYNGQIAQYGWGRWAKSGKRQWLNSAEPAGHWWTPQNDYDEAPAQHATVNGFMHGLPSDFLAVLKPVKVETARDYRYPAGGASGTYVYDITYDKFFLTSKEEEYTVVNEPNHREGLPFQYWIERLTPEALEKGEALPQQNYASADNTHALTSHIRYALENHTSAQYCRLRSANRGYAYFPWYVTTAGAVGNGGASYATRCAPACVIC